MNKIKDIDIEGLAAKSASLLLKLHEMYKHGSDETDEADELRDRIESIDSRLPSPIRERLSQLSADLYDLTEMPQAPKSMNQQASQKLWQAMEARATGDYDKCLSILRRWKAYLPIDQVDHVRASVWSKLGNPDVAGEFLYHAHTVNRENPSYYFLYLSELMQYDPNQAEQISLNITDNLEKYSPVVVTQAMAVLLHNSRFGSSQLFQGKNWLKIFDSTEGRWSEIQGPDSYDSTFSLLQALKAFYLEQQGNREEATNCLNSAIQRDAGNDLLKVARGILTYGKSQSAVNDFETARWHNVSLVWPYFFLAHYYLITRRFEDCRDMCMLGRKYTEDVSLLSRLLEWQAISEAELGYKDVIVRARFESAIEKDEFNDLAKINLGVYLDEVVSGAGNEQVAWKNMIESRVREMAVNKFELRMAA